MTVNTHIFFFGLTCRHNHGKLARKDMDVNEHERLSNITLRHNHGKLARKDMDVNEHERLTNITLRPKKNICVFTVTCQKNLGSTKPEIVVSGSGIRFQYFIFEISGKPSFVEAVL